MLTGHEADAAEHLGSQSAASDGTDHVDCVFLFFDEISPSKENVSALVDVDIVFFAGNVRVESFLEIALERLLGSDLIFQRLLQLFLLLCLLACLSVSLADQFSALLLLVVKSRFQFIFALLV